MDAEAKSVKVVFSACSFRKVDRPELNQQIISLGRILKDEQTLASYEIVDGLTVHLVRGKTAAAAGQPSAAGATGATTTAPGATNPGAGTGADPMAGMGGMGGMPGMGGMGGMPGMGMPGMGMPNMAAGGGPNGMGGMGGMDPAMMSQMMGNPMVQQMLSNPEFMNNMI